MKSTLLIAAALLTQSALAVDLPQNFNFSGTMTDASGVPLSGAQPVKFQIYNPAQTCLLYEEDQSITPDSNGNFSAKVGTGTRTGGNDPALSFKQIFQNYGQVRSSGSGCSSGYTPSAGEGRSLVMTVAGTVLSPFALTALPMATVAESVQGFTPTMFVQTGTVPNLTQANVDNVFGNYSALMALIGGTSTQYVRANGVNGVTVPQYPGNPTTPVAGSMWYDSVSNTMKFYDGSTAQTLSTGTLPAVGSPGTYTKVSTDAQGRVVSGAALAPSDIPAGFLKDGGNTVGTDMTIGTLSPYGIRFSANATTQMTLSPTGKLGIGTATPAVSLDLSSRPDAIAVPRGMTAQRPPAPVEGMLRFNTDVYELEVYDGGSWMPAGGFQAHGIQQFTGNGTFTAQSKSVKVTVIGGGGGGCTSMGSGGNGGAVVAVVDNLMPGQPVTVTVGTGGTQGTNGSPGGSSSFGSFVSATAGQGCTSGSTGADGNQSAPGASSYVPQPWLRQLMMKGTGGGMSMAGSPGYVLVEW